MLGLTFLMGYFLANKMLLGRNYKSNLAIKQKAEDNIVKPRCVDI